MWYNLETVVGWAKRRGFVYPGSDIYGGLANAWDLWPYGAILRKNILDLRWKTFVQKRQDIVSLDSQILMNPKVWVASGHVWWFSDPLIDCKKCWTRFRADKMIEEEINRITTYIKEHPNQWQDQNSSDPEWNLLLILQQPMYRLDINNLVPESWTFEDQKKFIESEIIAWTVILKHPLKCPNCKAKDWTDIRKFNLMFKTKQWVTEDSSADIYLRPETAQWIFVNFKNILDTMRVRVPFGIAQVGKAFRNEITPWNFLYRIRELEQMEIEYFVEPGTDLEWLEEWKKLSHNWRVNIIWITEENLRFRKHEDDELSHYSKWTYDVEYKFPWGWWELQWIADRTDFDLTAHMKESWQNMQYTDPKTGKRYIPYVIEPSWGLTRAVLTAMLDSYDEESYQDVNGETQTRTVARFHKNIAPIKFAILPLIEKSQEMIDLAQQILDKLSESYICELDAKWWIGKRYRRQDEIWTPYCITIDHDSLAEGTVTIRDRDTMQQTRVKIEDIKF